MFATWLWLCSCIKQWAQWLWTTITDYTSWGTYSFQGHCASEPVIVRRHFNLLHLRTHSETNNQEIQRLKLQNHVCQAPDCYTSLTANCLWPFVKVTQMWVWPLVTVWTQWANITLFTVSKHDLWVLLPCSSWMLVTVSEEFYPYRGSIFSGCLLVIWLRVQTLPQSFCHRLLTVTLLLQSLSAHTDVSPLHHHVAYS